MTPEQIKQWRQGIKCPQREAAALLNTAMRTYQSWESGERAPPGCLWLACMALAAGIRMPVTPDKSRPE